MLKFLIVSFCIVKSRDRSFYSRCCATYKNGMRRSRVPRHLMFVCCGDHASRRMNFSGRATDKNGMARLQPPRHPIFHPVPRFMPNFTSRRSGSGRQGSRDPGIRMPGSGSGRPGSGSRDLDPGPGAQSRAPGSEHRAPRSRAGAPCRAPGSKVPEGFTKMCTVGPSRARA